MKIYALSNWCNKLTPDYEGDLHHEVETVFLGSTIGDCIRFMLVNKDWFGMKFHDWHWVIQHMEVDEQDSFPPYLHYSKDGKPSNNMGIPLDSEEETDDDDNERLLNIVEKLVNEVYDLKATVCMLNKQMDDLYQDNYSLAKK